MSKAAMSHEHDGAGGRPVWLQGVRVAQCERQARVAAGF